MSGETKPREAELTGKSCEVCGARLLQAIGCTCGCGGREFCPVCIRGAHS